MSLPEGEGGVESGGDDEPTGSGVETGNTGSGNADPTAATGGGPDADPNAGHNEIDGGLDSGSDSDDDSDSDDEGPQGRKGPKGKKGVKKSKSAVEVIDSRYGQIPPERNDVYDGFPTEAFDALEVESDEDKSRFSKKTKGLLFGGAVTALGSLGGLGYLIYWLATKDGSSETETKSSTPEAPEAVADVIEFSANSDGDGIPKGQNFSYNVLANDIPVNPDKSIDKATVVLFDPKVESEGSKSVDIPNEGTWSVDAEGVIEFQPIEGFLGAASSIEYQFKNTDGELSNKAEISVIFEPSDTLTRPTAFDVMAPLGDPPQYRVNVLTPPGRQGYKYVKGTYDLSRAPIYFAGLTYFPLEKAPAEDRVSWGLNAKGRKTRKIMIIKGEGTWKTITGPDGNETGEVEFLPIAGFTQAPSPIRYQIADNKGNASEEAIISISHDFDEVRAIIDRQSAVSDSDYWSNFHKEITDEDTSLTEIDFITYVLLRATRLAIIQASDTNTYRTVQSLFPKDKLDELMDKWLGDDASVDSLTTISDIDLPAEVKAIPLGERVTRLWIINSLVSEIISDVPEN